MMYYKNGRLKKVKGGYIVSCDKVMKSKDAYDGMSHIGSKEEVFTDGKKAMERIDEMYSSEVKLNSIVSKAKAEKIKKSEGRLTHDDDY